MEVILLSVASNRSESLHMWEGAARARGLPVVLLRRPQLLVFDEAQRAHDAERVAKVHRKSIEKSEPQHLIEFCERIPEWSVLVALIGDGQAIHVGEEGGAPLWASAIRGLSNWTVHGSPRFSEVFSETGVPARWSPVLNLDTEIRFHLAPKVHKFVGGLIDGLPTEDLVAIAKIVGQENVSTTQKYDRRGDSAMRKVVDSYEFPEVKTKRAKDQQCHLPHTKT